MKNTSLPAPAARTLGDSLTRYLTVLVLVACSPGITGQLAVAQSPAARAPSADLLEAFVRSRIGEDHRVEIRFGELPPGTKLAPCQQIEPFMANGTRLWGRTTIGVRCVSGARWSIALPVNVRVFGKALVAARSLQARTPLTPTDITLSEVELSRMPGQPVTDIAAVDGQMATRPIQAGQTIMRHHLAIAPTVSAGDPIRVVVSGRGFSVTATGAALAAGSDGQPLRVRTPTGKVLVGTLRGRTVRIGM